MVGYLGCLGKVRDAFNIVMYDSTVVSIKMTLIKTGFLWDTIFLCFSIKSVWSRFLCL